MIGAYLADTRLLSRDQPDEGTEAYYFLMVQFCNALIKSNANIKPPPVVITYSAQRKCELVELGEDRILIFDKNLGQAFNTLNRILFFGEESISAYRGLLRYVTDEAILFGRSDIAAFFAMKTGKYAKFWDLPMAITRPGVWTQTYLQELFVFAHEYCHLIGSIDNAFHASRARVGKLLMEPEDVDLAKLYEAYVKRYGNDRSFEEFHKVQTERKSDLEASQDELVDELGCDDFAIHVLAEYCRRFRIPLVDSFRAAFLALRHVRAINYVRAFVRQLVEETEPSGFDRRVRLLQHRQHRLRMAFPYIVDTLKANPRGAPTLENVTPASLDAEISDLSDRHDSKVDEVLLFELFPNLSNEFVNWKKRYKMSAHFDASQCILLASTRGWSYGIEKATFVSFPKGMQD